MREAGIDISHKKTQAVFDVFKCGRMFNFTIAVCDGASAERCPIFPGVTKRLHGLSRSSVLTGTKRKSWRIRPVRHMIKKQIETWCAEICYTKLAPKTDYLHQTENQIYISQHQSLDEDEAVHKLVREGYSKIAVTTDAGCCSTGVSCCGSSPEEAEKLAKQIGSSAEEVAALPEGANMGLSCGNPAALAALKPGETAS